MPYILLQKHEGVLSSVSIYLYTYVLTSLQRIKTQSKKAKFIFVEINEILKGQNIIGFTKKQRLNWLDHVERMVEDDNVQKIKRWKPMSKRPIGRSKTRWEDDVLEDIKSMNVCDWRKIAENKGSWKKVVEQARTLYRL